MHLEPVNMGAKPGAALVAVTAFIIDGSPMMAALARGMPLATMWSIIGGAPTQPISSS